MALSDGIVVTPGASGPKVATDELATLNDSALAEVMHVQRMKGKRCPAPTLRV